MRTILAIAILALVVTGASAEDKNAPATTETNIAALEVRAEQHFLGGEWAQALPMYKKIAEMVKDDPERLGPIEERIRVCEKNVAKLAKANLEAARQGKPMTLPPGGVPAFVQEPPPTAEQRKPHAAPKDGQVLDLLIKDLGNFDYDQDKGGNIPADVKRLSGHTVRVRGFMIPMDSADNITKFALVPDLFACCFGQPPQIQHMVVCGTPPGKAVSYSPDEIVVEGKLNVEEKKDDG